MSTKDALPSVSKQTNAELDARCQLLLAMVACRRWQMNAHIERVMGLVVKCKKFSSQAAKA